MRDQISEPQRRIVREIARCCQEEDMPPTNREIGQALGMQSTGHVDYHLRVLERKGYLERDPKKSRGLRLTPLALAEIGADEEEIFPRSLKLPVVGRIAAGQPLEAQREYDHILDLGEQFRGDDVFALRVRGKSMIEDHIDDGDYVVVRRNCAVRDGDVVVALVTGPGTEGEATLKRLYRERNQIRLQPANASMEPIIVAPADVIIQGRVISVIRPI